MNQRGYVVVKDGKYLHEMPGCYGATRSKWLVRADGALTFIKAKARRLAEEYGGSFKLARDLK